MMKRIVPLGNEHHKSDFQCGNRLLERYIKEQAKQDVKRDLAACFVLVDQFNQVKGYYTLSAGSVPRETLPEELAKKLPGSYSAIPTILLGRVACDQSIKGQGFGAILLIDALKRSFEISASLGSLAVVVDPIDEQACNFYRKYEFIELVTSRRMFLPMKTIKDLFAQ